MQSSGVGNCINMLSLSSIHRTPMPMIVTMRGDYGEFNPAQVAMGQATQAVLEAMGTIVNRADHAADVEPAVEATLKFAFNTFRPPRPSSASGCSAPRPSGRIEHAPLAAHRHADRMPRMIDRRELAAAVLAERGKLLVVAGSARRPGTSRRWATGRRTCRSGAAWGVRR
jgi:dethiobiotin synthetase